MEKFKPCPLCGSDVMYYDGNRPCDNDIGKHFVCMGCDTMFLSSIIDMVWYKYSKDNTAGDESRH